jgi:hypothetical protein
MGSYWMGDVESGDVLGFVPERTIPDGFFGEAELSEQHIEGMVHLVFGDHADQLGRLGFSATESFWLSFACLPFVPWDDSTPGEVHVSDLLNSFLRLYQAQVEELSAEDQCRLRGLLKCRYLQLTQVIRNPASTCCKETSLHVTGVPDKWSTAAILIQQIAHKWQSGPAFPYRLVEDI